MKRVATALVLVPLVLAAVLWLPQWVFSLAVGAVALLAMDEYLQLGEAAGFRTARYVIFFFTAVLFVAFPLRSSGALSEAQWIAVGGAMYWGTPRFPTLLVALTIATAFFTLLVSMRRDDLASAFAGAAVSVMGVPYIALTLGALVLLRSLQLGAFWLLYLFVVVWSGDIFAYYVGRSFGRHKLAPRISPGKTWEGAAASLVASVALGTLVMHFAPVITGWMVQLHARSEVALETRAVFRVVGLSAMLNVVAQLGDLFESFLKRAAGVKDSGTLVPGHGGVLDRIDALLFAAPLLWYYALLTNFV